MLGIQ